jgi:hypothetical protein
MPDVPPPDAPDLPTQNAASLEAGFQPSPTGAELCGFGIPGFTLTISLPPFDFPPPFPPPLALLLGLSCDLDDPLDAELSFGGGRVSAPETDPDEEDT